MALNETTLEDLLRMKVKVKDISGKEIEMTPDFRVSVQHFKEDKIHFIIHPEGYNGETIDFVVKGNKLEYLVTEEIKKTEKDNIIELGGITNLNIDPNRILKKAIGKLDSVVLTGYDKEGELYFASSKADGGDTLWLLEKCKQALLNIGNYING